jgi:sorting nexin-1/2
VQRCQKEFEDISAEIKREVERFELNRAKDFKATIVKYLQDQMVFQKQILKYWENYVPAAREIA